MRSISQSFWGAVGVAVALCLIGCASKHHDGDVFGFVTDCPEGSWEACRRRNNSADRVSVQAFQNMLNKTFEEAYRYSPLRNTTTKNDFELVVVRDSHVPFMFQSSIDLVGGKKIRVIQTSAETFATISKIAIARHFYGLAPKFEEDWLAHYLLYIRKTPNGHAIADPLRASGLISMTEGKVTPGAPDFTDAIRQGINDTYTVIMFMVAHELYHLESPFQCLASEPECAILRRNHEADADRSATEILQKIAFGYEPPDHALQVPTYVFSQLMLTMEGSSGRSSVVPGTHPPNHERLRSAASALSDWIKEHPGSPSAASLGEFAYAAIRIVERIESETPPKYFAALDQEALPITLDSLKIY